MPYIGNDPVKNASVGTDQLKDDAVTNSKIIDDITFNTGSFGRVESTNYSGEGGALTGVATPASVTSSFAQKSAVSSSISEPAANVSGSSVSTGSFSSVVVADKVQGNLSVGGNLSVTGTGQGWVKLDTVAASTSATVDMETGFDSTYDQYMIKVTGALPVSDGCYVYGRLKTDAFQTGADYAFTRRIYDAWTASTGATKFEMSGTVGNDANEGWGCTMWLDNVHSTTQNKVVWYVMTFASTDGSTFHSQGSFAYTGGQEALTGIQFYMSTGSILSGTFTLYGLTK